ncbi:hypothetical protein FGG78_31055 [Thioclava sp. BHET1]|nr:hypothetical protein FGG78_31055 [Thioclava sp. BHET1]
MRTAILKLGFIVAFLAAAALIGRSYGLLELQGLQFFLVMGLIGGVGGILVRMLFGKPEQDGK